MTNEKEQDCLELEKIKLERFKEWRKVITLSITVLIGTFGIAYINHILQNKQLDQRRLLNETDRKVQQESDPEKREVRNLRTEVAPSQAELYLTYPRAQRFLDRYKPRNYIDNKFEVKLINDGKVVIDQATGLVWQHSGSNEKIGYQQTQSYLDSLNREQFAGYSDWRLPTLDESVSLLEQTKMNGDLYINPVFNKKQSLIWTSDLNSSRLAWVVHFSGGGCSLSNFEDTLYVRAVR